MNRSCLFCALVSTSLISAAFSQSILTDIRDVAPEEIKYEGFRLGQDQEVAISGVGFRGKGGRDVMFTRAWILDAQTRKVIWEIEDAEIRPRSRLLAEFEDTIRLRQGDYEVYYSTFPYVQHGRWENFLSKWFDDIFDEKKYEDHYREFREELRSFNMMVRGRGERLRDLQDFHKSFTRGAFISIAPMQDDEFVQRGFELKKPMDIRIYAIGEAQDDGTFDYGWIVDADTRKKVWRMTYRSSDHAGGARKNRLVDRVVSLPKGRYVASFVTDDSHAFRSWNMAPPHDPLFWGMTLKVVNPSDLRDVQPFDFENERRKNVFVQLTRLRDDEFVSKGFTLKKRTRVRVYALGEGNSGEMYDYSWIVDARSHQIIWQMEYHDSEHAGGGQKNRLVDTIIELDKGSYIVYAVTDGSHSYWDWNTAPPLDKEAWGITLSGADSNFDLDDVEDYQPGEDDSILARLVRMRDREYRKERFTLDHDSNVRVYALGEGSDGRMYDYARIEESETGRVIWEMTYRMTRHAGGANKNRQFDDVIFLRKGEYDLCYESDTSHSFEDWNQPPPWDPTNWGVTLYLVE